MVEAITSSIVMSDRVAAPVAKFVAARVYKKLSSWSEGSVVMAPFSPPLSLGNSLSSASDNKKINALNEVHTRRKLRRIHPLGRIEARGHEPDRRTRVRTLRVKAQKTVLSRPNWKESIRLMLHLPMLSIMRRTVYMTSSLAISAMMS